MLNKDKDTLITNSINELTEKLSSSLLHDFMKLPQELQLNIVLIKSAQLLLANIICQVANTNDELAAVADTQGQEMKELTHNCAIIGYPHKFHVIKH